MRRGVFEHIPTPPDAAIDRFLADVLLGDADVGIRSLAANALGARGTGECLPVLAKAAANDEATEFRMGCIVGRGRPGTPRRSP